MTKKVKLEISEIEWIERALSQAHTELVEQWQQLKRLSPTPLELESRVEEIEIAKSDCEDALAILRSRSLLARAKRNSGNHYAE